MFSMLNASLIDRLRSALPSWKNARLECLGYLIVSILRNRTVNLAKLSSEASGDLKAESLYRRFQNFFFHFAMPFDDIARLVVAKLSKPEGGWVLSMDRTNWKASNRPPKSPSRREIWGFALFFSGCSIQGKNTRDDFLYLASNRFHGKEALVRYRRRWGIEQVFSHFKKRGFDLETTHMSAPRKIKKLFGVLTQAFMISYGWGCEIPAFLNWIDRPKYHSILVV